jgi:hypothetical protein
MSISAILLLLTSFAFTCDAAQKGSIYIKGSGASSWQTYARATSSGEAQDRQAQARATAEDAQQQANAAQDRHLQEEKELAEKVTVTPCLICTFTLSRSVKIAVGFA